MPRAIRELLSIQNIHVRLTEPDLRMIRTFLRVAAGSDLSCPRVPKMVMDVHVNGHHVNDAQGV